MTLAQQFKELIVARPEGMTVPQLARITGKKPNVIRMTMTRSKGFYVADWLEVNSVGRPAAVWKWSDEFTLSKPQPATKVETGQTAQYHREYTAKWRTQIRGPWPNPVH